MYIIMLLTVAVAVVVQINMWRINVTLQKTALYW
jgi:hypothetical protein